MIKNLLYIAVLTVVLGFSILGRNGFVELLKFDKQLSDLKTRLGSLKSEVTSESDSLYGINNNPGYLEKIGREELGLSKKGEVIYVFDEKKITAHEKCRDNNSCQR